MKAVRLRTEYLTEPMGLGIRSPRFFWNCEGGIRQSAYQIIAKRGTEVVWDSGKVNSDAMTHIRYQGKELNSRDIVSWTVCLWDEEDRAGEISECHATAEPSVRKAQFNQVFSGVFFR